MLNRRCAVPPLEIFKGRTATTMIGWRARGCHLLGLCVDSFKLHEVIVCICVASTNAVVRIEFCNLAFWLANLIGET